MIKSRTTYLSCLPTHNITSSMSMAYFPIYYVPKKCRPPVTLADVPGIILRAYRELITHFLHKTYNNIEVLREECLIWFITEIHIHGRLTCQCTTKIIYIPIIKCVTALTVNIFTAIVINFLAILLLPVLLLN